MRKVLIFVALEFSLTYTDDIPLKNLRDPRVSASEETFYEYAVPVLPANDHDDRYKFKYNPTKQESLHSPAITNPNDLINQNPLLAAWMLSTILGLPPKHTLPNHPELLPINPFIALLLSQYGRHIPLHGKGKGLYAYAAANNIHNNQPFGSYKIYEDDQ